MGRSYRKTNKIGNGGCSEKDDKRFANRKLRRRVKNDIINGEEELFPLIRELSDIWCFNKDGKSYFGSYQEFMKSVMNRHRNYELMFDIKRDEAYWTKVWRRMKSK